MTATAEKSSAATERRAPGKNDPRIALVAEVMQRVRYERLKRMIEVRDLRKNAGRVRLEEEAAEIIAALDAHDVAAFDAALAKASRP